MIKTICGHRIILPIIDRDGSLELRPTVFETENSAMEFSVSSLLDSSIWFVHKDFKKETDFLVDTLFYSIEVFPECIILWDSVDSLRSKVVAYLQDTFEVDVFDVWFDAAISVPSQNREPVAFTYEIFHTEDYDDGCGVCTESTETIHTILDDWLSEAILVEEDWGENKDFVIKNTKKILILKNSTDPVLKRLLDWFVTNFEETIKFASIDKIVFHEYGTLKRYEYIINY